MTTTVAIVVALGTVTASLIGAYATTNGSLSDLKADIRVVEEREDNHYLEVSKKLNTIEKKLDQVLYAGAQASQ